MNFLKDFVIKVTSTILTFLYGMQKQLGIDSIIVTIILMAIIVRMGIGLFSYFQKKVLRKVNKANVKSLALASSVAVFIFEIIILSGVFFVMNNINKYVNVTGNVEIIKNSPRYYNNILSIIFVLTVTIFQFLRGLLPKVFSTILSRKKQKKKATIAFNIYTSLIIGFWSYILPVGIGIYYLTSSLYVILMDFLKFFKSYKGKLKESNVDTHMDKEVIIE